MAPNGAEFMVFLLVAWNTERDTLRTVLFPQRLRVREPIHSKAPRDAPADEGARRSTPIGAKSSSERDAASTPESTSWFAQTGRHRHSRAAASRHIR
jgi:hypothetical protein